MRWRGRSGEDREGGGGSPHRPAPGALGLGGALGILDALRIVSWNAEGLFLHRRHALRAAAKRAQLSALTETHDVVIICEAHGLQEDDQTCRREFPHLVSWLSVCDRAALGGDNGRPGEARIAPARACALEGSWRTAGVCSAARSSRAARPTCGSGCAAGGTLRIVGVQIPPQMSRTQRTDMLTTLRCLALPLAEGPTMIIRDMNMTHGVDMTQEGTVRMDSISEWWAGFAPEFIEVPSPSPTRRHTGGGVFVSFATLDRAFVHVGEADLLDFRPSFEPTRSITDRQLPSDHAPMRLTFCAPPRRAAREHIPDYVAKHEDFGSKVAELFAEVRGAEAGPYEALLSLKACMVAVADQIKAALRLVAPRTAGARFGCALRAWRAWRTGNAARLHHEVRRMPMLTAAVQRAQAGDAGTLREVVRELGEAEVAEHMAAAGGARLGRGTESEGASGQAERARRRAKLWAPRGRQMRLTAARGEDGCVLDPAATLDGMTDYWEEQFASAEADDAQQEAWLRHSAPPAREVPMVTQEHLEAVLRMPKSSSPGPDGIVSRMG